jgi:hypothetical protein
MKIFLTVTLVTSVLAAPAAYAAPHQAERSVPAHSERPQRETVLLKALPIKAQIKAANRAAWMKKVRARREAQREAARAARAAARAAAAPAPTPAPETGSTAPAPVGPTSGVEWAAIAECELEHQHRQRLLRWSSIRPIDVGSQRRARLRTARRPRHCI